MLAKLLWHNTMQCVHDTADNMSLQRHKYSPGGWGMNWYTIVSECKQNNESFESFDLIFFLPITFSFSTIQIAFDYVPSFMYVGFAFVNKT